MHMRVFRAAALLMLLAWPAHAQFPKVEPKTATEIEAERAAQRAYEKSLGNIPDKAATDPWGIARGEDAPPKRAAKTAPAKRAVTGNTVK